MSSLSPALLNKIEQIKVKKATAAARGNLRAVKFYDLQLKSFFIRNGIVYNPAALKVNMSPHTQKMLLAQTSKGLAQVENHGVPGWFRPGYKDTVRTSLWLRLSQGFRKGLTEQHQKGKLPEYFPAPSYWAKKVRASDFFTPSNPEQLKQEVAQESPDTFQEGDPENVASVLQTREEQAMEVIDEATILQTEAAEEEALVETLEEPGDGALAAEEPWYHDNNKLMLAGGALLVLLAVSK